MGQSHIQLRLLQDRDQHSHCCNVHIVICLVHAGATWYPFLNYEVVS
jgi:hypothetical protein